MNLNRIITIVIFLSIFLSACSPATAPTEPPPTSAAATDTVAESPTETEASAATATAASEELEIVESFGWIDELGDYRVEMLVRNPYDHPEWIDEENSWARILDSTGDTLVEGDIYTGDGSVMGGLGYILPGETLPASSCLCGSSDIETLQGLGDSWAETLTIGFDLEPADPESAAERGFIWATPSTDFDVLVKNFFLIGFNQFEMDGTVENIGGEPVNSAYVRILLYDNDNNYVGWGEAAVLGEHNDETNEFATIEPGAKLSFSAFLTSSVIGESLDYRITVIGRVVAE